MLMLYCTVLSAHTHTQLLKLNSQQHSLQSNLSQMAGELTQLRDMPSQVSSMHTEIAVLTYDLSEALATLEELSVLSAAEISEKDDVLGEWEAKWSKLSRESQVSHWVGCNG